MLVLSSANQKWLMKGWCIDERPEKIYLARIFQPKRPMWQSIPWCPDWSLRIRKKRLHASVRSGSLFPILPVILFAGIMASKVAGSVCPTSSSPLPVRSCRTRQRPLHSCGDWIHDEDHASLCAAPASCITRSTSKNLGTSLVNNICELIKFRWRQWR